MKMSEALECAKMHFEDGTDFGSCDFTTDEEYEEYCEYVEMGPGGFYDEFSGVLKFSNDFIAEYGNPCDIEQYQDEYEKFKLQWLIDHNYSLKDFFSAVLDVYQSILSGEDKPSFTKWIKDNNQLMEAQNMFENEIGFNGEIWPCFDEWFYNDRKELD